MCLLVTLLNFIWFFSCYRVLNHEKILQKAAYNRYYEKPYLTRGRLCWERCKRIYNSEMSHKLQFISRKNRVDPWPRWWSVDGGTCYFRIHTWYLHFIRVFQMTVKDQTQYTLIKLMWSNLQMFVFFLVLKMMSEQIFKVQCFRVVYQTVNALQ